MGETHIQWTDHTINPFAARNRETGKVGHYCNKISDGCKHCYASKFQGWRGTHLEFLAENLDKVELFFAEDRLKDVLKRRIPTKYFWCDMTDMFLEYYPDEWIDRCFEVMAETPQHIHQVLTKRVERLRDYSKKQAANNPNWPLQNVWLGASVENQKYADLRIPVLLDTPATLRFLSVEPLLGPVVLPDAWLAQPKSWTIIGGESGSERPCDLDWIQALVNQCADSDSLCFVKQAGHRAVLNGKPYPCPSDSKKGGFPDDWPKGLRVRESPGIGQNSKSVQSEPLIHIEDVGQNAKSVQSPEPPEVTACIVCGRTKDIHGNPIQIVSRGRCDRCTKAAIRDPRGDKKRAKNYKLLAAVIANLMALGAPGTLIRYVIQEMRSIIPDVLELTEKTDDETHDQASE